jgi:hypothetical protein
LALNLKDFYSAEGRLYIAQGAYSDPNRHPFRWQIDTRSD